MEKGNTVRVSRLKQLRKEKSMRQEDVARYVGCTIKAYQGWERDSTPEILPNTYNLKTLAELFGVSTDYILGRTQFRHVENEEISRLTGLSEQSLLAMRKDPLLVDVLNMLLSSRHGQAALRAVYGFLRAPAAGSTNIHITDDGRIISPTAWDLGLVEVDGVDLTPYIQRETDVLSNYERDIREWKMVSQVHLHDLEMSLEELRKETTHEGAYVNYSRSVKRVERDDG